MKKKARDEDMLPEYDFSGAAVGKYWKRFEEGTNLILLEPDVRKAFPDSKSVNEALRRVLRAGKQSARKTA
jgi:hypothetical protein